MNNLPIKDIVIIDDRQENLHLLTEILELEGYKVRAAINGRFAIQVIENKPPDLILLDIHMPELDGFQVCEALKNNPKTKNIPIIFISAFDNLSERAKAFEVGGVDYINKPFAHIELITRVKTQLSLSECVKLLGEKE